MCGSMPVDHHTRWSKYRWDTVSSCADGTRPVTQPTFGSPPKPRAISRVRATRGRPGAEHVVVERDATWSYVASAAPLLRARDEARTCGSRSRREPGVVADLPLEALRRLVIAGGIVDHQDFEGVIPKRPSPAAPSTRPAGPDDRREDTITDNGSCHTVSTTSRQRSASPGKTPRQNNGDAPDRRVRGDGSIAWPRSRTAAAVHPRRIRSVRRVGAERKTHGSAMKARHDPRARSGPCPCVCGPTSSTWVGSLSSMLPPKRGTTILAARPNLSHALLIEGIAAMHRGASLRTQVLHPRRSGRSRPSRSPSCR